MSFEILALKSKAFSLTELLVTLAIIGTLSVVGIRTYRNQLHTARTAEAQQILAYIYTNERQFHNTWDTYHENLIVVGAVPSGQYSYDAGFFSKIDNKSHWSDEDGDLENYPIKAFLKVDRCQNFRDICNSGQRCKQKLKGKVKTKATEYEPFFDHITPCHVSRGLGVNKLNGQNNLPDSSIDLVTDEVFKAYATAKLGGSDDVGLSMKSRKLFTKSMEPTRLFCSLFLKN